MSTPSIRASHFRCHGRSIPDRMFHSPRHTSGSISPPCRHSRDCGNPVARVQHLSIAPLATRYFHRAELVAIRSGPATVERAPSIILIRTTRRIWFCAGRIQGPLGDPGLPNSGFLCLASVFVVQSNTLRARRERALTFEVAPAILQEGLGLTAIGVSTAFALLIVLSAGVWAVGRFLGPKPPGLDESASTALDGRDKALAAAVAVSVLREIHDNSAELPPHSSDSQLLPQD